MTNTWMIHFKKNHTIWSVLVLINTFFTWHEKYKIAIYVYKLQEIANTSQRIHNIET